MTDRQRPARSPESHALLWLQLFGSLLQQVVTDPQHTTNDTTTNTFTWGRVSISKMDKNPSQLRIVVEVDTRNLDPSSSNPVVDMLNEATAFGSWEYYCMQPWFREMLTCLENYHAMDLKVTLPESEQQTTAVFGITWNLRQFLYELVQNSTE